MSLFFVPIAFLSTAAVVVCDSGHPSVASAFQAAFDRNPDFWSQVPYTTMPAPKLATVAEADAVILLRVLIDLYMNEVRHEQHPSALSAFIATLPVGSEPEDVDPKPYYAEPSPQRDLQSPIQNLLTLLSSMLTQSVPEPQPPALPPMVTSKLVLDLFGSMVRKALYSDDDVVSWRAALFVTSYVKFMANSRMPYMTALAVLARDLILADDVVPSEAQVKRAADFMNRFVVIIDETPDLSSAADLIDGGRSKLPFSNLPEMSPEFVLNLLVRGVTRGHSALCGRFPSRAAFCSTLSGATFPKNYIKSWDNQMSSPRWTLSRA